MSTLKNISIRQGGAEVSGVNLTVAAGEYGVLMGRSGCGKTTILEAICGLRSIESGSICLGDEEVSGLPPAERGVGYVPQDRALFPTMIVREQLAFALVLRKQPQTQLAARVNVFPPRTHPQRNRRHHPPHHPQPQRSQTLGGLSFPNGKWQGCARRGVNRAAGKMPATHKPDA